uniref:Protein kinase domain-containing protein n=1 Tax=Biomphalaria glabrata TaxID=6526 RepID=A0A2C9LMH4_BIOGL
MEQIGIGGYSNVYRAKAFTTNDECEIAVKEINLTMDINKKNFKSFETEINALAQLSHERIVTFYGCCQEDFSCFIFIEYIPLRSLCHFIRLKEVLSEDLVHQFTKQLLEGIQYLHGQRIIHRDIKSLNILMSSETSVKLTDFGIAKIFGEYSRTFTKKVGTVPYMAPELLSSEEHSYSVDIWALGCVVIEMFTGEIPFPKMDEGQIHNALLVKYASPLEFVNHKLPIRAEQFLKNIFNHKPEYRPSATDLLLRDHYITGNLENIIKRKLTNAFRHCNKNEDHGKFIPVKEVSLQHLPENYREKNLSELITTIADLTVKLSVAMVSPNRPEVYPNTDREYPFYGKAGNRISRVSSGEIFALSHYVNGQMIERNICLYSLKIDFSDTSHEACSCAQCLNSGTPSQEWYEIFVSTTTCTVFDEIEASQTTCTLFYDDEYSSSWIYLFKPLLHKADVEKDFCAIKFVTCDIKLGEKLQKICKRKNVLFSNILKQYENSEDRLCFIVSHPHGCPKYVSIGQWVENNKVSDYNEHLELTRLKYTTATCPGSAGATVYCVGHKHTHVHSGRDGELELEQKKSAA